MKDRLKGVVKHLLEKERFDIQRYEHFVSLSLPENMLKRGYTITTRNGKTIKSISDIAVGEVIQTRFLDGEVDSKIIEKNRFMENEKITYAEAKAEIEKIVSLIDSDELDVDQLTVYVKRASKLVAFCKQKLTETDEELQNILDELNR